LLNNLAAILAASAVKRNNRKGLFVLTFNTAPYENQDD
jgi:hypothetical protein